VLLSFGVLLKVKSNFAFGLPPGVPQPSLTYLCCLSKCRDIACSAAAFAYHQSTQYKFGPWSLAAA
jgi:hypothetical protein